jgi:pimeloyl-ACP methyl ester carboxylesterase
MPTVRTNDVETYYERHGSGRALVFVHGAWLNHHQWTPQVDGFAAEYEVVTYDLRGHGRSGGSTDGAYSVELYAADLRTLVEALGLEAPVVCGLSLGGMVAQTYAARYGNCAALVLADTAAARLTWQDRARRAVPRVGDARPRGLARPDPVGRRGPGASEGDARGRLVRA